MQFLTSPRNFRGGRVIWPPPDPAFPSPWRQQQQDALVYGEHKFVRDSKTQIIQQNYYADLAPFVDIAHWLF